MKWRESAFKLHAPIKNVSPTPTGFSVSRPAWIKLNRLRIGVGLFRSETHKWGMASTAACECGGKEQIAEHVITSFPLCHDLNGPRALLDLSDLADGNMSGHLVEYRASVHFPQTKKKIKNKKK